MKSICQSLLLSLVTGFSSTLALAHDPAGVLLNLDLALKLSPQDSGLLMRRGHVLGDLGRWEQAKHDLLFALDLQPNLLEAHRLLARAYVQLSSPREAKAQLGFLLAARPGDGAALWSLGRVLSDMGEGEQALALMERSLPRLPRRSPGHYLELAELCLVQDQVARGLGWIDAGARELGPLASLQAGAVRLGRTVVQSQTLPTLASTPPQTPTQVVTPQAPASPVALAPVVEWVSQGSEWRYLDDGSDQGTLWRSPAFDDDHWSVGDAQLGYGDGDEQTVVSFGPDAANKYPTTYFRRAFQVARPAFYGTLNLGLQRDDGAVVYLNGTELFRSNMPLRAVTHLTFASSTVGGAAENQMHEYSMDPDLLLTGRNVLAVEVHQRTATSSDISFDLRLVGEVPVSIVRGPYLQTAHTTGITVRWSSSDDAGSTVWLGPNPQSLAVVHSTAQALRDHAVVLTGLYPGQLYYYAVGDSSGILAGGDASHFFRTAPTAASTTSMRIWAIGDSGTANADARAVRNAYQTLRPSRATDVWLMLGDNAYNSGTAMEYQAAVFDTYPSLLRNTPLWPTLGNHDARSAASSGQTGVYYDVFSLPTLGQAGGLASGTEAYYSFDHGRVHFVCLDSQDTSRALGGAMMSWLQADLAASTSDWTIAFWHHPPYTKGSHDSDNILDSGGRMTDMREVALPILEAAGVDLVLGGHSHVYERSFLLDGHYGLSTTFLPSMALDRGNGGSDGAYKKSTPGATAHEGTVYTVAGSSGKTSTSGTLAHPAFHIGLRDLGSVVIDIEDQTLIARFLNSAGAILDTYTIIKG